MEQHKASKFRWVILAIYMYVAALTQLYWLNFTSVDTYIEEDLHISAMNIGFLALVFPFSYVVLSLPSGIIIDRKGFKYGIGIGVAFTAAFSCLRVVDPSSYPLLLVCQLGISIGQPFILNGITKLVAVWFPKKEEATAVGMGSLSMFIGMIVALGITPFLVQSVGFRAMILIYAGLGAVGAILFFLGMRSKQPGTVSESRDEIVSNWAGIKKILRMRDFVILGFVAFIGIGVFNGLATWLEKILYEMHRISMVDAAGVSALLVFGGVLGCVIVPLLSDRINRRKPFLVLAPLVGAVCVSVLIFQDSYMANLANGALLGFFLLSALPIMLTASMEITGEKLAGISVAYLLLLGNGAAVLIVPAIELLHNYEGDYVLPLALTVFLLAAAFLMATRIRETARLPVPSSEKKTPRVEPSET
jgi:MFS family permease